MVRFNCTGLKIFSCFNYQIELWLCPPRAVIPRHIHPDIDSRIVHVFGRAIFLREDKKRKLPFFSFFKNYSVKRNIPHSFINLNNYFVFLNIEKWYSKPTSAAINLTEIPY